MKRRREVGVELDAPGLTIESVAEGDRGPSGMLRYQMTALIRQLAARALERLGPETSAVP